MLCVSIGWTHLQLCCECTANCKKIREYFAELDSDAFLAEKLLIKETFVAIQAQLSIKGKFTTRIAEKTFSETRHLGNRAPYRPPRLYTMQREICNLFHTQKHHDWYKGLCDNVYKTKKVKRKMEKRKISRWTGFKLFCSVDGLMGNVATDIWKMLPLTKKMAWSKLATKCGRLIETLRTGKFKFW